MKLPSILHTLKVLAATMALVPMLSVSARPADAREWFYTTEGDQNPLPYSECVRRAPLALSSLGLTVTNAANSNGNPHEFWGVDQSNRIYMICIGQASGFYLVESVYTFGARTALDLGNALNRTFWQIGAAAAVNLTGTWTDSDGTIFNVQQTGNTVTWHGQSRDGMSFIHGFTGTISGNQISGHFQYVGSSYNGDVVFQIADANTLTVVSNSVQFGRGVGYTITRMLPG
jgi:hypothetical protein